MNNYFIVYDLEDFIVAYCEDYKSLSKFFGKTVDSMQCSVSRFLQNKIDRIISNYDSKGYKVYKFNDEVFYVR